MIRAPAAAGAAVLVAVMATATVHAQRATPVEGAGDFNSAPIIGPGLYRDTIRAGENLYYAVDLATGQRLRARATLRRGVGNVGSDIGAFAQMRVYEATREGHTSAGAQDLEDLFDLPVTLAVRSSTAGDPTTQTEAAAGTWFVEVELPRSPAVRRAELDVRLRIEVRGEAVEVPSPTPTPTVDPTTPPPPTPPGDDRDEAAPPPADGDGSVALFLAMFLVGLVGGAALEAVKGARART